MCSASRPVSPLISARELARLIEAGEAIALDATYYARSEERVASEEFEAYHIPGARFFDIESVARQDTGLPHMVPDATAFEQAAGALGISEGQQVVVYDRPKLRSAPRVWWTFRYFGHNRISVLDGGLQAWQDAGLPLETGRVTPEVSRFRAKIRPELLRTLDDAMCNVSNGQELYLDARPAGRFCGLDGDNWTPLRGHIRGSHSIPSSTLIGEDGRLRPRTELKEIFREVLDGRKVVVTCGSGIAASVLAFALQLIGQPEAAVFDGSWAEWSRDPRTAPLTETCVEDSTVPEVASIVRR